MNNIHMNKHKMVDIAQADYATSRLSARNTLTVKRWHETGTVTEIWFHRTCIVSIHPDGMIMLNSGGYHTPTTKSRMNDYLQKVGCYIYQQGGIWYLNTPTQKAIPFVDYIRLYDGVVPPAALKESFKQFSIDRATIKLINRCVNLLGKLPTIPQPQAWDCFICHFTDHSQRLSCISSHISEEETYIHGSLIVNAMRWAGFREIGIVLYYRDADKDQSPTNRGRAVIKRTVKRYLKFQLGIAG